MTQKNDSASLSSPTSLSSLSLESSLQVYFFDELQKLNAKSSSPLSNELIFFTSIVMEKFAFSGKLFEVDEEEGKVNSKVLGMEFMAAAKYDLNKKKRALKDIGDTALFISGYFNETFNKKIIDSSYYEEIGASAYQSLNNYVPRVYNIDSFYKKVASSFTQISSILSIFSKEVFNQESGQDILFICKAS